MPDHCVKLRFPFSGTDLSPIFDLEDALEAAITAAGAGEFDGNDVGQGECTLYMYGPDADALSAAIQGVITAHHRMLAGGHLLLRYGPAAGGVRKVKISIPNA
jgi:hypothetical protein